ncbi:MAG: hypothetical protein JXP34_29295 [Planctomycetes bacterium]|nr:hypothetical protein [Planctomycetota bacterium]
MAAGVGPMEFLTILALAGSFLFPVGVPPLPPDPGIAQVVPADAIAVLELRGVGEVDPSSGNEVERLLAEPEVKAFSTAILQAAESALGQGLAHQSPVLAREVPVLAKALLTRPAAVYIDRLAIRENGPPDIRGGILLHAGDRADDVDRALQALTTTIGGRGNPQGIRTEEIEGATLHWLQTGRNAPPIAWGRREAHFFIGVGEGVAPEIAQRLAGKGAAPRPAAVALPAEAAIERPGLVARIRVAALLDGIPERAKAHVQTVLDASGLGAVQALTAVSGLQGKGFASRTLIETRGELGGVLSPFGAKPIAPADLAPIPADATVAMAGRLDLEKLYRRIVDVVGRIEPRAREQFERNRARAEAEIGVRFSEDLFQGLGDSWRIYNSPSEGGLLVTGLTLVADLRDEARVRTALSRISSIAAGEMVRPRAEGGLIPPRATEFRGKTILTFDPSAGQRAGGRMEPVPLAPSWCFTDGKLVLSLFPQMVKAYIARGSEAGSIADRPEVKALWDGGKAPLAVAYTDSRAFFRLAYPFLPPAAAALAGVMKRAGVDLPASLLPSAPAIEPHLGPTTSAIYRTEGGILIAQDGTVPVPVAALAPFTVPATMLLFTVRTASVRSEEAQLEAAAEARAARDRRELDRPAERAAPGPQAPAPRNR